MATITSAQTGLASDTATWVGGVVPIEGDKVIVAAGHVVTVDGTYTWGDDSVTSTMGNAAVNVYGTLKASRTVNSSLTGKGLILLGLQNGVALDYGTQADPLPAGIKAEIVLNKAATPAFRAGLCQDFNGTVDGNSVYMWSADPRLSNVKLASTAIAGSAVVTLESGAHNWVIGDTVMLFKTTDGNNTYENETRTISNISGNQITLNAALTYTHLSGSPVANFTRNIVVRSYNEVDGQTGHMQLGPALNAQGNFYHKFCGVEFRNIGRAYAGEGIVFYSARSTSGTVETEYTKCSMRSQLGYVYLLSGMVPFMRFTDCVASWAGGLAWPYTARRPAFFEGGCYAGGNLRMEAVAFYEFKNLWFTATSAEPVFDSNVVVKNLTLSGQGTALIESAISNVSIEDSDLGYTYGWNRYYGQGGIIDAGKYNTESIKLVNTLLNSRLSSPDTGTDIYNSSPYTKVQYLSKNRDSNSNEIWSGSGKWSRDNSVFYRGSSSFQCFTYSTKLLTRELSIPCASGASIRVIGYIRRDTATTAATVTISGLGITPVTYTASGAVNTWEQYDLTATNSVAGYDGNLTLTYTANAASVTTSTVYFDGVPDAPFVTKCRHYGFLFAETSPTREVNPYTVASEATAAAYTGVTINATTKRVTFGSGTADTFAKVYDYSQAWGCLNIADAMPWTRAGALLSLATGWTVVQPTISGLTWGGGTLEWTTPGTITGSFDSVDMRFATAGTYDISPSTFAGTITLSNTSGGGVIVILIPAGIDYVNDGPNIDVQVVVEQAAAAVTNITAGSRIQVYNETTSTEIANEIVSGTTWSLSYPNGTGFSAGDTVRVRLAWHSGATAKTPIQQRTVATASGWAILADQQNDTVYNFNAIDGDTCTEFDHDYVNVQIDVSDPDGVTTVQRGYAWYVAGQLTANGIRYFHGGMTAEDELNYRVNVGIVNMHIQNISTSTLLVMGGRLYRSDGSPVAVPGNGPLQMEYGRVYGLETGVSGLTAAESNRLMSIPTTAPLDATATQAAAAAALTAYDAATGADVSGIPVAPSAAAVASATRTELATELARLDVAVSTRTSGVVDANITKVNGTTVNGSGTTIDPWGP